MLTLLTYRSDYGQFSLSPFCVKAAYLLTVSCLPWQREDLDDPRPTPHQKLPVLRTEKRLIADSDAIRTWLESQGTDFDPGLSDLQKARSRALIRMAEEHLYFHVVMDRWVNEDVWPTIREDYFGAIPALLRKPITNGLRKSLKKGLTTHGIARYSPQERTLRLEDDLWALRIMLEQSPFLFGAVPTAADFSVAPMLAAMASTPTQTDLVKRVANDDVLAEYLTRMMETVPLP